MKKIGTMVGERFDKFIKDVVPPQMFLIIDASKTESPVHICWLVMWEVPPGCILRKMWIIVPDSWDLSLWRLEHEGLWVQGTVCDPLETFLSFQKLLVAP